MRCTEKRTGWSPMSSSRYRKGPSRGPLRRCGWRACANLSFVQESRGGQCFERKSGRRADDDISSPAEDSLALLHIDRAANLVIYRGGGTALAIVRQHRQPGGR